MTSIPSLEQVSEDYISRDDLHRQCADLQAGIFADWNLIIAANRGPVTFEESEGGDFRSQRGGGGLVTSLIGLCQHMSHASWIACARSEADVAWQQADVPPLEGLHDIQLQFLEVDAAAYEGYYNIIANPLLWFLQHSMWDTPRSPVIDRKTWEAWETGYVTINRLFAEAIAVQTRSVRTPTLVMLQDYHLYLVARYLHDLMPPSERPIVTHFIHIPWPGPEYWRILPPTMRQAILDGLCAVDLLGFQTRDDGLNFIRTCETYLPQAAVKFRRGRVWYKNHAVHIRDFPISIDVETLKNLADSQEVTEYHNEIQSLIGDKQLILRVDRIEPSKNIVRGFQAFEEMLEIYPEYQDRVVFLALLVPSRLVVDEYQRYLAELMSAAGRVNAKYGSGDWEPIRVLVGENYPRAVAALQKYDALLVNAIADGMNLVAKEGPVVNKQNGVLILSEGTGACQQLQPGALKVSPFDVYATAQALHQALVMTHAERQVRADRLRWIIEREDIRMWMCEQLDAIARLFPERIRE